MRYLVPMALATAVLTGCISVPKQAVPGGAVDAWQGKTVALTERPRAGLVAMTAGKAMFALVGAGAAIASGSSIVKEDGIEDPAHEVGLTLLHTAQQRYGVVPAAIAPVKVDTTDVATLAAAAHGADLLIDVQSTGEVINYFPTNWSHYWVGSGLVVRVIDVHSGVLLGGGTCHRDSRHESSPPTRKELLSNQGRLLKTILGAQWDSCEGELAQKALPAKS